MKIIFSVSILGLITLLSCSMFHRSSGESSAALHARLDAQAKQIAALEHQSDSLKLRCSRMADSVHGVNLMARFKNGILENLTLLATLYGQRNFDVEQARTLKKDIMDFGDLAVPELQAIALDKTCDGRMHSQAVSLLGELGTQNAQDAVFEVLSQTHDPETVIEGCIAAGRMQDQRAEPLLIKFADDKNTGVAFAALSALKQLK